MRMIGIVIVRSFVYFGLVAFVATYYERELGVSAAIGNVALTIMLASGAVGTLVMGPLADRFGRRVVVGASMLVLPPLIYAFTLSGPYLGMVLLAFIGAATVGTFGVTVVMGQEYLPGRIGLAAGITMGLSIGLGGLGAPILGYVADQTGLAATMLRHCRHAHPRASAGADPAARDLGRRPPRDLIASVPCDRKPITVRPLG